MSEMPLKNKTNNTPDCTYLRAKKVSFHTSDCLGPVHLLRKKASRPPVPSFREMMRWQLIIM